jgi:hypothetical protein
MIAVLAFGLVGAALAVTGVYFLTARWRKRAPLPYCLSAFVFHSLVFIAAFQYGVLNSDLGPGSTAGWLLTALILAQAAVTAVGVAAFTLLTFSGYLFLMGELDYPVGRVKSYAGCAFFCFLFSVFLNPIGAAREDRGPDGQSLYQAALDNASPEVVEAARREAERTLAALREIGALTSIDDTGNSVVHHVKGQFIDLPNAVVEEYMRAALVHHVLVEGRSAKPVILREIGSNRQIAQREPNGTFRRPTTAATAAGEAPLAP